MYMYVTLQEYAELGVATFLNEHVGFNYWISHFRISERVLSIKRAAVGATFDP